MSNVEDTISWLRFDMTLGVLDEQEGADGCGHHDMVAFVSKLPAYPCCVLSKQWVLLSSGVIHCFGPDNDSRNPM
jgi:hypothetical protein